MEIAQNVPEFDDGSGVKIARDLVSTLGVQSPKCTTKKEEMFVSPVYEVITFRSKGFMSCYVKKVRDQVSGTVTASVVCHLSVSGSHDMERRNRLRSLRLILRKTYRTGSKEYDFFRYKAKITREASPGSGGRTWVRKCCSELKVSLKKWLNLSEKIQVRKMGDARSTSLLLALCCLNRT